MPPPFGTAVVNGITFAWASGDTQGGLASTMAVTALMPPGVRSNIAANGFMYNLSTAVPPAVWPYARVGSLIVADSLFGYNGGAIAWSRFAAAESIPDAPKKNTSLVLHETGHTVDSLGAGRWSGPEVGGKTAYGGSWDTTYFLRADYDDAFGGPEQFALPAGSFNPLRQHPAVVNGFQTLRAASLIGSVSQTYASRLNEGEYLAELFAFYCWNNLTSNESPISADATFYPGSTARETIDNYFYAVLSPPQRQELASAFASHMGVTLTSGLYPTWPVTDTESLILLVDSGAANSFVVGASISGPGTVSAGVPTGFTVTAGGGAYSASWTVDGSAVSTAVPTANLNLGAGTRAVAVTGRNLRGAGFSASRTVIVS